MRPNKSGLPTLPAPPPSLEELRNIDLQRFGNPLQHVDRGVAFAALDLAQIGLVHVGSRAKLLLRKLCRTP